MSFKGVTFNRILFTCFIALFVSAKSFSENSGLDTEYREIVDLYESVREENEIKPKSKQAKKFVQSLKWTGISDESLFDRVEQDLLTENIEYSDTQRSRYGEYISWLVQSLAYSGNEKYRDTIESFGNKKKYSSKIVRHAKRSLEALEEFQEFNPMIVGGLQGVSYEDLDRKRVTNFINSEHPILQRVGARMSIEKFTFDAEVMDSVEARLLESYKDTGGDRLKLDAMSWMARALGESGNRKYLDTLSKVNSNSPDAPVRKWSGRSIRDLGAGSSRRRI